MKKVAIWSCVISAFAGIISWGVVGLKILTNDYDFTVEAYIAYASFVVLLISIVVIKLSNKCPHCGAYRQSKWISGAYCSHCGKKID